MEEEKFDCEEYYKKKGFQVKNEVVKEKCIYDFFKERYKWESKDLEEEGLKSFLNKNLSYITKLPPLKSTDKPNNQSANLKVNI